MGYILIIGANSDIGLALAKKFAENGYNLYLAVREPHKIEPFASNLHIRTKINIACVDLDVLDYSSHDTFYHLLKEKPIGVIVVAGYLGNQNKAEVDFSETQKIINTNFIGIVSLINIICEDFEKRKSGFIFCISSVAGDRGRKSNYIYGSAKAGLTAYLSGIRNRLYKAGIHVLTIKPGFVATKMTAGMDLPEKLTAQPEYVADKIFKAYKNKTDVLYVKWVWRWIMFIIKAIPERTFKKMDI